MFLNYPNFRAKWQQPWTAVVVGMVVAFPLSSKRPKQGTKTNASLEDAATVCQHLCQLFKMHFYIFIIRSNINALHFLCGGLTLSPQILECPSFCHWKATNLSITASDISPVIPPLAFQKQLLQPQHSQQINLCILPDHQLLPTPPSPAPSMLPFHSAAAAFSFLCQCCFALRHRLLDGVEQSSSVLLWNLNNTLSHQCHMKTTREKHNQFQLQCGLWHFKEVYGKYLYDRYLTVVQKSALFWCNYSIFIEFLGAIPYSFSACRVQQNPHCLNASCATPCSPP